MKSKLYWWRYEIYKWWHDKLPMWIAFKLPQRLVMWCAIRVGGHATTGKYGNQVVPELYFVDALERWDHDHSKELIAGG